MRLLAISDLHLGHRPNREALVALPSHPDDWLIVAGDVGETPAHLDFALRTLKPRFARLLWVPGNHELWATDGLAGDAKYRAMVDVCRSHDTLTPEDPWVRWEGAGGPCRIALLFLLYDYSFRPPGVPREAAVAWAMESGVLCADEQRLHPDPFPTREAWCAARCAGAEARLDAVGGEPLVLVNHFPLRRELVRTWRIPRFEIWCGTTRTSDWHLRYGARAVVAGHLHIRTTDWIDGVRFEEVGLGYPREWRVEAGLLPYLREILPGPPSGWGTLRYP